MRLTDLKNQLNARKKMTMNTALFYSLPVGFILFLLTLPTGFFNALLFGVLIGAFLFALIYGLRELTHKSVDKRRAKLDLKYPHMDVRYKGEMGVLEFAENALIFHTITPGGANKEFQVDVNENVFIACGPISYGSIQKWRHRGILEGYILVKEMPSGIPRQFLFYEIDDAIIKVNDIIGEMKTYSE